MEFKKLKSNLKDIAAKFKYDLIDELYEDGHHDTGALEKSIRVNLLLDNNNVTIQIRALYYIQYLEDGVYLSDFIRRKQKELLKMVPALVKQDITEELNLIKK